VEEEDRRAEFDLKHTWNGEQHSMKDKKSKVTFKNCQHINTMWLDQFPNPMINTVPLANQDSLSGHMVSFCFQLSFLIVQSQVLISQFLVQYHTVDTAKVFEKVPRITFSTFSYKSHSNSLIIHLKSPCTDHGYTVKGCARGGCVRT
jgi:hypothetical protein